MMWYIPYIGYVKILKKIDNLHLNSFISDLESGPTIALENAKEPLYENRYSSTLCTFDHHQPSL